MVVTEKLWEVVEEDEQHPQCSPVESDSGKVKSILTSRAARSHLWTGLASSAFLRKGDRNLKRAVRSWAYIGQPFCWGVRDRIRPMNTR